MTECPSVSKQPRMFTSCPPAGLCLTSTSTFAIESEAEILVNEPHDFSADLVGIFDRLIGIKASLGPQEMQMARLPHLSVVSCLLKFRFTTFNIKFN